MSKPFIFKQFTIQQNRCAMKIGTDGVLLGAWAPIENKTNSILDIGSGTGVIALQLAQRSGAETIDAIEIDADTYEQCSENFEASQWADRLFCYHASLQEFVSEVDATYDLIVSNPPFYSENYTSKDLKRNLARFSESLPFQHLLVCVAHLLSPNGTFATILPRKEEGPFIHNAKTLGLFPYKICRVKGTEISDEKRSMVAFSRKIKNNHTEILAIEKERHVYTKDYENLVKDFYLKM